MEKVKVGFIGVGGIASVHLKNIHNNGDAEVAAVCDIVRENAIAKGEEFGVHAYTDVNEMLDNEKLDAVYVCVPPFAHGDIEEKVAERGIHLLVEKPVALDMETAQKKADAIQKSGVICASGYCLRYLDTVKKAKEYLEAKEIAMVRGFYLSSFVPTPWFRVKSKSGGQLVEQATHIVDMIRYVGGDIDKVYANMSLQVLKDIENIDIPDVTSVNFTLASGAVGHLDSTLTQPDGRLGMEVLGRDFRVELDLSSLTIVEKGKKTVYKEPLNFMEEEDRVFVEAVKSGNRDLILASYEDGVQTLEVSLAANQSGETGEVVAISS